MSIKNYEILEKTKYYVSPYFASPESELILRVAKIKAGVRKISKAIYSLNEVFLGFHRRWRQNIKISFFFCKSWGRHSQLVGRSKLCLGGFLAHQGNICDHVSDFPNIRLFFGILLGVEISQISQCPMFPNVILVGYTLA